MTPADPPGGPNDKQTGARRAWAKPKLVEYGHISKLTQGNSGMNAETQGQTIVKPPMCL